MPYRQYLEAEHVFKWKHKCFTFYLRFKSHLNALHFNRLLCQKLKFVYINVAQLVKC